MSDYLDGLIVDPNLPGSYSHAIGTVSAPVAAPPAVAQSVEAALPAPVRAALPVVEQVAQAVAADPNAPVTLKQLVNAFQVFAPAAPAVTPGNQASEYKLTRAVCTFLSAAASLYVALTSAGAIPTSTLSSIAVPGVLAGVIGWLTSNYVNSRTAVKVANSNPPKA